MIATVLLGAGTAIGLWLIAVGLYPPKPALRNTLLRISAPPRSPSVLVAGDTHGITRAGRVFVPLLQILGQPGPRLCRDLAVAGVDAETQLATKSVFAVAGFLTPALATVMLAVAGISLGVGVPVLVSLALGLISFLVPDMRVHAEAARRRADFRYALSAYLDHVVVSLAGGAGVEGALHDSAGTGSGWAFARLRRALDVARLTRVTPWATLQQLGEDLGVDELAELAATAALAGSEGAKIRASLAAKASSLRTHLLSESEGHEQSATERMSLPVTLLFLGFLVFIGYPAIQQILAGI